MTKVIGVTGNDHGKAKLTVNDDQTVEFEGVHFGMGGTSDEGDIIWMSLDGQKQLVAIGPTFQYIELYEGEENFPYHPKPRRRHRCPREG